MARSRTLDPANLPHSANPTTDPKRQRELNEEFQKRLRYLAANYSFCQSISKSRQSFNDSIETVARSLSRKRRSNLPLKRLHPDVESVIARRAHLFATVENRDVNQADVDAAGTEFVRLVPKQRGAPKNSFLRYHVAGLIALVQQFSAQPVLANREKPGEYAPHFVEGVSQIVPQFFEQIDPEVRLTTLVECAISIRKEYARKELDFLKLFPTYRTYVDDEGQLKALPGVTVEEFEITFPIYSR